MKKISSQTKAIADSYINAKIQNKFDSITPDIKTKQDLINKIKEGNIYREVLDQIEIKFCPITSILMSSQFNHTSHAYKAAIYKGFKVLLD